LFRHLSRYYREHSRDVASAKTFGLGHPESGSSRRRRRSSAGTFAFCIALIVRHRNLKLLPRKYDELISAFDIRTIKKNNNGYYLFFSPWLLLVRRFRSG
jgi:hypothetical protein